MTERGGTLFQWQARKWRSPSLSMQKSVALLSTTDRERSAIFMTPSPTRSYVRLGNFQSDNMLVDASAHIQKIHRTKPLGPKTKLYFYFIFVHVR